MDYKVIDHFLTEEEIICLKHHLKKDFLKYKWYDYPPKRMYQDKLLGAVAGFVNVEKIVGFEEWSHNPHWKPLPTWHLDKNEDKWESSKELELPICSCIYYLNIENLVGGNLLIKDKIEVVPKSNRLVLLKPGVWHAVDKVISGTRVSLNINPWEHTLK